MPWARHCGGSELSQMREYHSQEFCSLLAKMPYMACSVFLAFTCPVLCGWLDFTFKFLTLQHCNLFCMMMYCEQAISHLGLPKSPAPLLP